MNSDTGIEKLEGCSGAVRLAASVVAVLGLSIQGATACPTLTPSILEEYLAQGQIAFMLDDEGLAPTPWYFDLQQVSSTGAITGTMSTSAVTPSYAEPFYPVNGTASGSGSIPVIFSYSTAPDGLIFLGTTYAYSGAIMFVDSQCDLAIAGTFTTTTYTFREAPIGPLPVAHTSAATPFSGKMVGYVFE